MPQKTCEYVIRINETQRRLLLNACACHAGTLEYATPAEEETALLATLFGELADNPAPILSAPVAQETLDAIGVTNFVSDGLADADEFDVPVPSAPAHT